MKLLDGKVAIITGAGTGIGREAALMFAHHGADLALAGRRMEPLSQVADEARELGSTVAIRSVDLENGDAGGGTRGVGT